MLRQQIRGEQLPAIVVVNEDIALGIQTHGALAQIGRADPGDTSVGHHDLGMHVDRGVAQLVEDRADDPECAVTVGATQPGKGLVPKDIHGCLFEPARCLARHDNGDFRG